MDYGAAGGTAAAILSLAFAAAGLVILFYIIKAAVKSGVYEALQMFHHPEPPERDGINHEALERAEKQAMDDDSKPVETRHDDDKL